MANENCLWGAKRIHGELLKLAFLQSYVVLVVLEIPSRVLIAVRAATSVTEEWVGNVLRSEIAERGAPELLIHDRGPPFTSRDLTSMLEARGVRVLMTPFRAPKANAFVERVNGSIRRECLDHCLFGNERQLQWVLDEYVAYYNRSRCHQGIDQRTPVATDRGVAWSALSRGSDPPSNFVEARSYLGGLHHDYFHRDERPPPLIRSA